MNCHMADHNLSDILNINEQALQIPFEVCIQPAELMPLKH